MSHPTTMTPLGRTVRLGGLVLGEHGEIDVGGTRLPAGIALEDCSLGTGPDRAVLSRTPEGLVTVRHRGETLAYEWDPGEGCWYGPPPPAPSRAGMIREVAGRPGTRVLLAVAAVSALAWMLTRGGDRPEGSGQVADAGEYGGEADPASGFVEEFEAMLERQELGRRPVALSPEQEGRIADFFAAQARAARLLAEEMDPAQARMIQFGVELADLKDDDRLPFELRRRVAQLADPSLEGRFFDALSGERGAVPIAQRADRMAGRVLRGEGPFTLADAWQALDDQAALESSLGFIRAFHDGAAALLPDIPPRYLEGRIVGEGYERAFARMHAVDESVLDDPRDADELGWVMDRLAVLARTDGHPAADEAAAREARRLVGGYVARHSTLPGRMTRLAGDLERCGREAETLFAPMLAEAGVTPRQESGKIGPAGLALPEGNP